MCVRVPGRLAGLSLGLVVAGLGASGCGDSASVALPTPTDTIGGAAGQGRAQGHGRPAARVYTGLGAPDAVFAGSHRENPRGRGPGQALVSGVTVDRAGRVTAYTIGFNDRPPLSDYERLVSATGVRGLPNDHATVHTEPNCLVYGSRILKQLVGASYARVTTTHGTATALVASSATPTC